MYEYKSVEELENDKHHFAVSVTAHAEQLNHQAFLRFLHDVPVAGGVVMLLHFLSKRNLNLKGQVLSVSYFYCIAY